MTSARVSRLHRGLTAALVTVYLAAGLAAVLTDFGNALAATFFLTGAALLVIGTIVRGAPPWASMALVATGALIGGLFLVWTVVVPIAVALLIAITYSLTRQPRAA